MLAPASAGLCSDSTKLFELVALVRGECAFFCPGGVPAVLEGGVLLGGSEFGVRRVRLACVRVCLCLFLLILYTNSFKKKRYIRIWTNGSHLIWNGGSIGYHLCHL